MKCPACKFTCSELRDICPHCMLDLREHKTLHKIPITNSEASYQELIAKLSSSKKQSGNQSLADLAKESLAEVPEESSTETASKTKSSFKSKAKNPSEISDLDSLVKAAEQEIKEGELEIDPQAPGEIKDSNDVDSLMAELMQESKELHKPKEKESTSKINLSETKDLFELAFESVKAEAKNNDTVELGFGELSVNTPYQEMNLLFDVAYQTTKNPHILETFNQEIPSSKNVKLDSKKLAFTLEQVKKTLEAPAFSLKRKGRKPRVRERLRYEYAPRKLRLLSALIDISTCIILAVLGTFAFGSIIAPEFINGLSIPPLPERYAVLGLFFALLISLSAIYPIVSIIMYKKTLGTKLTNLQIRRQNERPLITPNAIVRGLLMPLSLICFGYAPLLFKKEALHDHFAKSKLALMKTRKIIN